MLRSKRLSILSSTLACRDRSGIQRPWSKLRLLIAKGSDTRPSKIGRNFEMHSSSRMQEIILQPILCPVCACHFEEHSTYLVPGLTSTETLALSDHLRCRWLDQSRLSWHPRRPTILKHCRCIGQIHEWEHALSNQCRRLGRRWVPPQSPSSVTRMNIQSEPQSAQPLQCRHYDPRAPW
jgi:hypothetical protein